MDIQHIVGVFSSVSVNILRMEVRCAPDRGACMCCPCSLVKMCTSIHVPWATQYHTYRVEMDKG